MGIASSPVGVYHQLKYGLVRLHANMSKTGIKYTPLTMVQWFPKVHLVVNICLILSLLQKLFGKRTGNTIISKNMGF